MTRQPPRLKRSESFFGVHFDFHAQDHNDEIGRDVTREMVSHIIDAVQPDYVQCDCKGHAGLSSYPTQVGIQAPGFVADPLKIWREVTAERGVALYIHYSGIMDTAAVKLHPDWAVIDAEGVPDEHVMSVHGPYDDELMIPQLKELSDVYGVDGMWVDGDWGAKRDYGEQALTAFRRETGIEDVPRKPEHPYWLEFTDFIRRSVQDFINKYIDAIHDHDPEFQITSNWVNGYKMPGMEGTRVDYLSADYNSRDSVYDARLAGRCFVHSGIPWDLMAWSFVLTEVDMFNDAPLNMKTATMLKQEAAVAISLGGGFEAYFRQKGDGSISQWQMGLMAEVAEFCRARQEICHNARPVPQIGLIYSGEAFYRRVGGIYSYWTNPERNCLRGVLNCLLDAQNVVDVLIADEMTAHIREYPLLIYPEWEYISDGLKRDLLAYVEAGGNLLLVGPAAAAHFESELGVTLRDEAEEKVNGLEYGGRMSSVNSLSRKVSLGEGVESFGRLYPTHDIAGPTEIPASINSYGKGRIAATFLNLGDSYVTAANVVVREFLDGLVRRLFPDPLVQVSGSRYVDVVVNRIEGKLTVNLVNRSGPHGDDKVVTYDAIPPVGPLEIVIDTGREPQRVTLEPSGASASYTYEEGKIRVSLPTLEIHDVIVVE